MDYSVSSESTTHDALIAGDYPVVTEGATLISGQNLTRGALLGKITASSKLTLSLSAAGDGSETPTLILLEDCDASAGDKECLVGLSGEYNSDAMTFGTGHTAASVKDGLRDLGIYLKTAVAA